MKKCEQCKWKELKEDRYKTMLFGDCIKILFQCENCGRLLKMKMRG